MQPQQAPSLDHRVRKRFLLIFGSIMGVILFASATILVLWLVQPKETDTKKDDPSIIVPDLSRDYGACQLLNKDTIKTSLGDIASDLKDGDNSGRLFYSEGVEAQYCSYDLASTPTAGNFKVEVSVYKNSSDAEEIKTLLADDTEKESIALTNDTGFYWSYSDKADQSSPDVQHFVVTWFSDEKQYTLSINQPVEEATIDDTQAKEYLTALANAI